jgi:hypothetical protein
LFEPLEDRCLLSVTASYEPKHYFESSSTGALSEATSGQSLAIARQYLTEHASDYGLEVADVKNAHVTDMYTDDDTGVTHIYLQETFHGLEVVNTSMVINIAADGRVLNVAGDLVGGLATLEKSTVVSAPQMTAANALERMGSALGLTQHVALRQTASEGLGLTQQLTFQDSDLSTADISTKLHYVATADGMKLAWNAVLQPSSAEMYDISIDTSTGAVLRQDDLVQHAATATYRALGQGAESPEDPDVSPAPWISATEWGTRDTTTNLPTLTDATNPASLIASPYGWHDTNGVVGRETSNTSGNNAITSPLVNGTTQTTDPADTDTTLAFYDRAVSPGRRATTTFNLDLNRAYTTYTNASVVNAYYWVNMLHDVFYVYGFDEASGNFQNRNYTGLGTGGDALNVMVQYIPEDSDGNDVYGYSAFATPVEGSAPTMYLGIFSWTSPLRDSTLDNEVIAHEYGHGLSNRLVGGPANSNALNAYASRGMGEGWSDFWSLMFTQQSGDSKSDNYPVGTYLEGEASGSGGGIRTYPYSYDMNVDPVTYGYYNQSGVDYYKVGEIWTSTLWDLNWLLIDKYGFNSELGQGYTGAGSSGNQLLAQLVVDSMKLLPATPTLIDGRDALLLADQIRTGGQNQHAIWQAFARRGMGLFAYDGGSANADNVTEDFTCPPEDPFVTSTSPSAEVASLSYMDFKFSQAMNIGSFSIADDVVAFTGPSGDLKASLAPQMSYTWLDSTTLRVSFPRQDVGGTYSLTIGPGILGAGTSGKAMDQDYDGTPGETPADTLTVTTSVVPDSFGYQAIEYPYESNTLLPAVDQGQETYDGLTDFRFNNTTARWQEFVPSESSLRGVGVNIERVGNAGAVTLAIINLDTGATVWTANVAQAAIPAGSSWVEVTIANGVALIPGQRYRLQLTASLAGTDTAYYRWNGKLNSNAYPLGVADTSTAYPGFDYAFRIYGTSATTLAIGRDDDYVAIPLGTNAFRFYANEFTGNDQLYVYTNGLVTLGGAQTGDTDANGDLRSSPEWPTIAAYWDNLYMGRAANAQAVISYEFDDDRLIIEWGRMSPYGYQTVDNSTREGPSVTFQMILQLNTGENTGSIIFNYPDLGANDATSNGRSATVGIKDYGIAGTHRIVVAQDQYSSPYLGTGKAVMIVEGGTIAGRVYNDANANGAADAGDAGVSGWGVYLDLNRNGQYDSATDTLTTTDGSGNYVFKYLPAGDYVVRQVERLGWLATAPAATSYTVTLSSGLDVGGLLFGDTYVNTAPKIADQSFPPTGQPLFENAAQGTVAGSIVATDTDLPAQTLTYTILSGNGTGSGAFAVNPSTGQITVNDPTQLDYETTPTFNLLVRVSDSVNPSLSASANIAIRLSNVNEPPVAGADTYWVPSGTPLKEPAPGLLANDKDPEGAVLSLVEAADVPTVGGGQVTIHANGSFEYTPGAATVDDSFTYQIAGTTVTGTATIHIVRAVAVKLSMDEVWESLGNYAGIGTVSVDNPLSSDLVVSLSVFNTTTGLADNTEIVVPATVTIPKGQTSATFDVRALDDTAEDGRQRMEIRANATGFAQGAGAISVRDNDLSYFYIAPIADPQVANLPFLVEAEARDAGGEKIDIYGGTGFFTANVNNVNIAGLTWETYVPAGEAPPEQAFEDGSGKFLVTIPTLQTKVQLVVADSLSSSSHKGYSNRFDVSYGPVSRFQIGSVSSPQYQSTESSSNPFVLTVTALDANGYQVKGYSGAPEITAWTARQSTASTIVISEIGDGSPDFVEVQNVTNADVNTQGWTVLVNDPTNADPTAVLGPRWSLPSVIAARGTEYRSDDATDAGHYWGANIPWGASTPQGWVLIIDDQFQVRDFVAWGYDAYTIESLEINVGATSVRIYDPNHPDATEWFDAGISYAGSSTTTLQRVANRDGNAAADFNWLTSSFQQTNPSLVLPFAAAARPVSMSPSLLGSVEQETSGIVRNGSTATVTLANHGFTTGQTICIRDAGQSEYNGLFVITVLDANHFRYTVTGTPVSPATGSITAQLYSLVNGQFSGGVQVNELASQVFLRVSDGQGHIGESNTFNVQVAPVPTSISTPGSYDPSSSTFYLKNSSGAGFANNVFGYGPAPSEWIPISGDWNGDGWDTVGLYDPATSTFYLTNANTGFADMIFGFGAPGAGWKPLAGDWDGDGVDTVGLYDSFNAMFYLTDSNSTGIANKLIGYGPTKNGWTPVAGNWDGKGSDGIGLYSPSDATFYLKNEPSWGMADYTFGFGATNWTPIAGDWDANGSDSIGAYDPNTAMFYERNANNSGYADTAFGYGMPNGKWKPVVGDWNGPVALTAANETLDAGVPGASLAADQLPSLVTAAVAQWSGIGLNAAALERLAQVEYVVTDLPGAELGRAQGNVVFLDTDAAGRGWFIDPTPAADEEFTAAGTAIDPAAVDRMDLVTVVAHELGHVAGLEHLVDEDSLMASTLGRGVRRAAGLAERDALFAEGLSES